jgi:hypothetical protein
VLLHQGSICGFGCQAGVNEKLGVKCAEIKDKDLKIEN